MKPDILLPIKSNNVMNKYTKFLLLPTVFILIFSGFNETNADGPDVVIEYTDIVINDTDKEEPAEKDPMILFDVDLTKGNSEVYTSNSPNVYFTTDCN